LIIFLFLKFDLKKFLLYKTMKRASHYEKVIEFNKAFGVHTETKPNSKVFDNPKLIDYRLSLVLEEINELMEAVQNKDFVETIDALADIEYVVLGFFTALGVNGDKAFDVVHNSNMSKLCVSEEEAKKTVEYYNAHFDKHGYDSPTYRLSDDGVHFVVYNKSTSKILKSINYTPADFKEIL
jgi:predicted HAD superfamily Cof-like phosphohydrolase